MENLFVPRELASRLKKIGFNEPYLAYFDKEDEDTLKFDVSYENKNLPAPTLAQAFKWFDEKTTLKGFVKPSIMPGYFDWQIYDNDVRREVNGSPFVERHEAEIDCLEWCIDIIEW